jgi:hypothetical protein
MPSMPSRPAPDQQLQPKLLVHQRQFQQLLDFHEVITEKLRRAVENETKVRLEELLEDSSIQIQDEYVEDQIRIICNNTGKSNFKQKVEDLKKFVIKK